MKKLQKLLTYDQADILIGIPKMDVTTTVDGKDVVLKDAGGVQVLNFAALLP